MNKTAVFFAGLLCAGALAGGAQATSFTYQGRLSGSAGAANGLYDFEFSLFAAETNGAPVAGPAGSNAVPVTNGLFSVLLDFGPAAFNGESRWLEISVKNSLTADLPVVLAPRQPITPTPYALHAFNAANLMSFVNAPLDIKVNGQRVLRLEPAANAPNLIGGSSNNNVGPGVFGAAIGGGDWNILGNDAIFATIAGGEFNTIEPSSPHSTIGGGLQNSIFGSGATIGGGTRNRISESGGTIAGGARNLIDEEATYAAIGGGFGNSAVDAEKGTIAGGEANRVGSDYAAIGGGRGNAIGSDSLFSTIAGGEGHTIANEAWNSSIGGGELNLIETQTDNGTIGGGVRNAIRMAADSSTIAGGEYNEATNKYATVGGGGYNIAGGFGAVVAGGGGFSLDGVRGSSATGEWSAVLGGAENAATRSYSTVGGGEKNRAAGDYAVVPGGLANRAAGNFSFAAGRTAEALHDGSWVWADNNSGHPVTSTTNNQFTARAAGGVRFFTDAGTTTGVELAPGAGSWSTLSDRNAKENFARANPREVLDKLASLPLATWNYKAQNDSIRHIGPVAQDFHAAFGVGEDERRISSVDADGVALAAIQGLNEKVEQENRALRAELDAKEVQIQELKKGLAGLRELIEQRSPTNR